MERYPIHEEDEFGEEIISLVDRLGSIEDGSEVLILQPEEADALKFIAHYYIGRTDWVDDDEWNWRIHGANLKDAIDKRRALARRLAA